MSKKPTVKIFISSHKATEYVHNNIFQPVQVNVAHTKKQLPGFQPDNAGDNISEKNPRFCELTAQYWAWKNASADYYGFFHYRRYLSFNTKLKEQPDVWGSIICKTLDEDAIEKYGWTEEEIEQTVKKYDIILPDIRDITVMPNAGKNLRDQYLSSGFLHEKDLDIMLDVLKEKYPDYLPYAEKYLNGHKTYLNNMFIMKKEIFEPYCEWLFDILFECDKRIDFSDYSVEAVRTPGHLAERLLNIYIAYLKDHNHYKIKELPTVVFLDTEPCPELKPAFMEDNVAIALSANDTYTPYVATLLTSIRENASTSKNYDILIMNKDISAISQKRLKAIFAGHDNFSLRFIDISRFERRFRALFLRGHFTIETWFRLLMPEILPNYGKILYLDSDLVVNADLSELYNTNIDDYLLAACHDADTAGLYNGYERNKKQYMDQILKIENPYDYFQAGVILFNLAEFRKSFTTDEMLTFAASYKWELLDQDVLNYLTQGRVKFVDMAWNVMFDWRFIRIKDVISRAPKHLQEAYLTAHADPKIIHYAGPDKPWDDPGADYAEIFWKYARMNDYYECILVRACESKAIALNKGFLRRLKRSIAQTIPPESKLGSFSRRLYHKIRH